MPSPIIRAPWSEQQVKALNESQQNPLFHPYTCGNEDKALSHERGGILVATAEGWVCLECDYRQNWAYLFSFGMESFQRR